jgi:aminopeptidase YwaD
MSLPSFVHDVAWAFAGFVNEQSYKFAATGSAEYPFVAPEGGKEPLRAEFSPYAMGSDHDVYQDSSFKIPAISLNDWPDRYIHTNFDSAANIDPTKLKRAAFIGAASGYFLAGIADADLLAVNRLLWIDSTRRRSETMRTGFLEPSAEMTNLMQENIDYDIELVRSTHRFFGGDISEAAIVESAMKQLPSILKVGPKEMSSEGLLRFERKAQPKGPLAVFGYDYFADHAKAAGVATPKLLTYQGLWGAGEEYAYEVLNFANGKRNADEIRDAVSAEYGPVPVEMVVEYLKALEKIGVVAQAK